MTVANGRGGGGEPGGVAAVGVPRAAVPVALPVLTALDPAEDDLEVEPGQVVSPKSSIKIYKSGFSASINPVHPKMVQSSQPLPNTET